MVRPVDMTEAQQQPGEYVEGAIRDEIIELIDRCEKPLFNFLAVLLGDHAAAQDCAQDAFLRAYEHLRRGRQVNAAWLYRVGRNRAIDELRRRKRLHPNPERIEAIAGRDTDQPSSPVRDALEHLSPDDREILYLFDVDGFEAREIGAMLGISRNAVHVRVFRARERFRKVYRPVGEEL